MFNSICLCRQSTFSGETPLDLGLLAEAMLFYENVRIVADSRMVEYLALQCGPELLLELINEGYLTISYLENAICVMTGNPGTPQEFHRPDLATIERWRVQEMMPAIFQRITGESNKGRKIGNLFATKVHPTSYREELVQAAREDYANNRYIKDALRQVLRILAPGYQLPRSFRFSIVPKGEGFEVETNLNLSLADEDNPFRRVTFTGAKFLSPNDLLLLLLEVRASLYFSSLYGGEIVSKAFISAIIQAKCSDIIQARIRNQQNIELFQDRILKNSHAIREAINSGQRSFKDLLKLLERSRKFRHWLQRQEPDTDLIASYYKEVTASTWVESLPSKTLRWIFLTGLGLALGSSNPVAGFIVPTALSAADTFLLEKLVEGWRPNQFVDGPLHDFTHTK